MTGLNIANETTEKRSFLVQQVTGMLLTVGAIVFAAVALTIIAILPAVSKLFPSNLKFVFDLIRWPLLGFLICFALAILYRLVPIVKKPNGDGSRWVRPARRSSGSWVASASHYMSRISPLTTKPTAP